MVGFKVPLNRVPNARSVLAAAPKLYTSPAVPEPVPAAYCPLLLPLDPISFKYQPLMVRLFVVPVLARVLKSCVYAVPKVARLTEPEPPPSASADCAPIGTTKSTSAHKMTNLRNRPLVRDEARMNLPPNARH